MQVFIQVPDKTKESGYRLLVLNFGEVSIRSDIVDGGYNELMQEKKDFIKNSFSDYQLKKNFMFDKKDIDEMEITDKYGVKRYTKENIIDSFRNKKGYKVREEK